MNEKHFPQSSKITPLFHSETPEFPNEETMLRFLDEEDGSESKRAFLNQLTLSDEALEQWQTLNEVMDAGKEFPAQRPDPAIRSRILDAAYAATQEMNAKRSSAPLRTGLPGWRWAWAALFLAMLFSGYQEFQTTSITSSNALSSTSEIEALDYELLTLEAEIEQLQAELGMDLSFDGSA